MSESTESSAPLSHVTGSGGAERSRMVDVGEKPVTQRRALATACVRFPPGRLKAVLAGEGPKGPVAEVARVAGVMAAKRTAEWIPLCHLRRNPAHYPRSRIPPGVH